MMSILKAVIVALITMKCIEVEAAAFKNSFNDWKEKLPGKEVIDNIPDPSDVDQTDLNSLQKDIKDKTDDATETVKKVASDFQGGLKTDEEHADDVDPPKAFNWNENAHGTKAWIWIVVTIVIVLSLFAILGAIDFCCGTNLLSFMGDCCECLGSTCQLLEMCQS